MRTPLTGCSGLRCRRGARIVRDYSCRGVSWWAGLIRRQGERGNDPHRREEYPMSQYLLSTYAVAGEVPGAPMTPGEMGAFMERVAALEAEMEASGTFVFGGALHGPDAATVVGVGDGDLVMTDGPFVEAKEHIAGFYIINADDLDAALAWARKVVDAIGHPIEIRPFRATGRVQA